MWVARVLERSEDKGKLTCLSTGRYYRVAAMGPAVVIVGTAPAIGCRYLPTTKAEEIEGIAVEDLYL